MSDIENTPPVALTERLSFLLKHASALLEGAIEPELGRLGMTGREFAVLTLVDSEGPASQQRLARRISVDRTTMVALIDSLEGKRLVRRRRDPSDRRAYLVEATSLGEKTLRQALKAVRRAEDRAIGSLAGTEAATLKRVLQSLARVRPPAA